MMAVDGTHARSNLVAGDRSRAHLRGYQTWWVWVTLTAAPTRVLTAS